MKKTASFLTTFCLATGLNSAMAYSDDNRPPVTGPNSIIFNASATKFIEQEFGVCTRDGKYVTLVARPVSVKDDIADQTQNNKPEFQAEMARAMREVQHELYAIVMDYNSASLVPFYGDHTATPPEYVQRMIKALEKQGFPIPIETMEVGTKVHTPHYTICAAA